MAKKFFGDVELKAKLKLSALTTEKVLTIDSSGEAAASTVTETELSYVSGVTSDIQTQLGTKIPSSEKGAANGVATLDGSSKLPSAQLPVSTMEYLGAHNVSTNSPTLIDGTGTNGDFYRVSVGGTRDYGSGSQTFAAGDALIYNGSIWEKIPSEDIIQSVNGATGVVSLDSDDISEGSTNLYYTQARFDSAFAAEDTDGLSEGAANFYYTEGRFDTSFGGKSTTNLSEGTNLYYTDERVDDRVAALIQDGTGLAWTYVDGSNTLTGNVSLSSFSAADLAYTPTTLSDWDSSADPGDTDDAIDQLASRLTTVEGSADSDESVKCSANDTTAGYLEDKIVVSEGTNTSTALEVSTLNDAGDEDVQIQIDVDRIRKHSVGDILETSFAGAASASAANVTGFAFAAGTVRSFLAHVSVLVDATADTYEVFTLEGIQKGATFEMSTSSTGDDAQVTFGITAAGQVTYTSAAYAGFVSMEVKFRAITTTV